MSTKTEEQQAFVSATAILPFNEKLMRVCPACGVRLRHWERFLAWSKGNEIRIFNRRFCAGGKAPTESRGVMDAIMRGGDIEQLNPCAGVLEPHLHLVCRSCSHEVLMGTLAVRR